MDKGKNTVGKSSGSGSLNRKAKPFIPEKTLFMKFSTDFPPISQQEIHDYFTQRFENCIENLYVPERSTRDSEYSGFITFSTPQIPYVIMGRGEEVVLFICTRPVRFERPKEGAIASYLVNQARCLDGNNNQNK